MLDIAKQVVDFYFKSFTKPELKDLEINSQDFLNSNGSVFVTLYVNGIVRGSSGNIKEIEKNLASEIIENTFNALTGDSRFEKINPIDKDNVKIRVDYITNRGKPLSDGKITLIDPTKFGVLVIKSDYEKAATILPNISGKLITGSDFIPVLSNKLDEEFDDTNYLVYKIETKVESNL